MTGSEPLSPQALDRLLTSTDPLLLCDDCFDQLDHAVEALLTSDTPIDEAFAVHLAACAVCYEEAESLATLVAADFGIAPADAEARLERAVETSARS